MTRSEDTDMTQESKLEKIKKRIRALLMKTVENGATEGEALSASEKAAQLMLEYDLEQADLADRAKDDLSFRTVEIDPALDDALWRVARAIAELCHCRVWGHAGRPGRLTFYGEEIDSSIAEYLMSVCDRAVRDETKKADRDFALYRANIRHRKHLGFIAGMSERLAARVRELAWDRKRAAGTGLVPAKMARINEDIKSRNMEFNTSGIHSSISDAEAEARGRASADEVSLNRGVGADARGSGIAAPTLSIADGRGR